MKVREVVLKERVVDPHKRSEVGNFTGGKLHFRAAEGYTFELHASGLAIFITGKERTVLAAFQSADVVMDDAEELPEVAGKVAKKVGKR